MQISTKGRYAVRIMIDVALNNKSMPSIKQISTRQNISVKYAEQIVRNLVKAKLLVAQRGAMGGYNLAKISEEISIYEILSATEGKLKTVSCLETEENLCPRFNECKTVKLWAELDFVITDYLKNKKLSELCV